LSFPVQKFDFLIDGRAKSSIDKFIATNPKFEAICEELQTYNGYVDQTQEITSLEYFTVVRLVYDLFFAVLLSPVLDGIDRLY